MNKLKEHIANIKELIAAVQLAVSPHLEETGSLEKEQKQLLLLEKHIQAFEKRGEDVRPELTAQKIKLILKIDKIETANFCAYELAHIGTKLTKDFAEFDDKSTTPRNSKIVNEFDGIKEPNHGAFRTQNLLREKVKKTKINELVKIINSVCGLTGNNSLYVFENKMISINDVGFHDAFYESINGRIFDVLRFKNVDKLTFTLSEALKYYVIYTLKRNMRDPLFDFHNIDYGTKRRRNTKPKSEV